MNSVLQVISYAFLGAALGAAAQAPEELRRLLDQGKAEEAYQLGRRAPERKGEPAFDYAYGLAAIQAGRPAEGVLALERFVLTFPDHEGARVDLARGYYLLGEDVRAKQEFEAALARKPPPEVARVIEEYMEAIREREARYRPTLRAYIAIGGGYDSNPRAGVDNPLITLPVLGEVTVGDGGVRTGDQTFQYGAGLRFTAPVNARVQLFGALTADFMRYPDVSEFNQDIYGGSLGAQATWQRVALRGGISTGYQTLNRDPYRRPHGLFGDVSWNVNETNAIFLGAQGGKFRYYGANEVRNADFTTVTAGWRHRFAGKWRFESELTANGGREKNDRDDRQDLSRDLAGVRLGLACAPWPGWTLAASLAHQRSDYLDPDPILLTTREDRYNVGELSLAWAVLGALSLRAEFTIAKNDSNLALYEYRRKTALVGGRYEFR